MPKYGKFRTRILAQEEKKKNAPVDARITKNIKPIAKRNRGVKFTPKTGPNAGEEVMFRMPPFPKLKEVPEDNKGLQKLPEKVRNNMGFKRRC